MPGDKDQAPRRTRVVGYLFIIFGILIIAELILDVTILEELVDLWPVILIIAGWKILRSGRRPAPQHENAPPETQLFPDTGKDSGIDRLDQRSFLGDTSLRLCSKKCLGGSVFSVIGDIHVNLCEIDFAGGERKVSLTTIVGNINLTLPEDFSLSVNGKVLAGGIQIFGQKVEGVFRSLSYISEDFPQADKRLAVTVSAVIGDIHIS